MSRIPLTPQTFPQWGHRKVSKVPVPAPPRIERAAGRRLPFEEEHRLLKCFEHGQRFKARGRRYLILGTKDHWTRDGRYVEMIRYRAVCANPGCKRCFDAMTTKTRMRRGQLNRRCERHHAPGSPVLVKMSPPKPKPKPKKRALGYVMRRLLPRNEQSLRRYGRPSYLD
jgi:hypothetical protein